MTLKQAFTQWAAIPDNKVLAAKNRTNMQKVLLEKHGSMDVTLIDRHFMDIVLKDCKADHRAQVNACSVLCHVLTWLHGNDPKTHPAPDFDYNIASTKPIEQPVKVAKPKAKSVEKPKVEVSEPEVQVPVKEETEDPLQGIDFSDEKENLNHISVMQENNTTVKRSGKAPIPVAQLDPKTLAVIKIWTSRSEAERERQVPAILTVPSRMPVSLPVSSGVIQMMPRLSSLTQPLRLSRDRRVLSLMASTFDVLLFRST